MNRKLPVTAFALLIAIPVFAETRQPPAVQAPSALHLMDSSEFAQFLGQLDTEVLHWDAQLKDVDVKSLGLDRQDSDGLEGSYGLCLESMHNTREEIERLSRNQTLGLDLLLLVDLNDLARNLDGFDRDLASAAGSERNGASPKSLSYVKEVLGIDAALALHTVEFQNHVFALAKTIDAKLEQTGKEHDGPSSRE